MKQTVTLDTFREAFKRMGRENQFSYEGLEVLFDFLEEWEAETGEETELDVIALCCDFTEQTPQEIAVDHGVLEDQLEFLHENTIVAGETDATIVYCAF